MMTKTHHSSIIKWKKFNSRKKNATYKIYRHNKDNRGLTYHLQFLQERLITSIESSKERYYARIPNRLNNTKKKAPKLTDLC